MYKVDVSCELWGGTEGTENRPEQVGGIQGKESNAAPTPPPEFMSAGSGNDLGQVRTVVCFFWNI